MDAQDKVWRGHLPEIQGAKLIHINPDGESPVNSRHQNASALARRGQIVNRLGQIGRIAGHGEGDRFPVEVASRLRKSARKYDTVARFGGDEFILLVSRTTPAEVEDFAVRVLRAIRQPFNVGESIVLPALSVGIAS